jgi:group I intron endonuclease
MKSGIYKIESSTNGNIYIGSAVNLLRRFSIHKRDLKKESHHSKILQNHVNKYGLNDLIFSVLEAVDIENLVKREQHYINSLHPQFNVCKIAGTCLGVKHDTSKTNHQKGEEKPNSKLTEKDVFDIREMINAGVKFKLIQGKYSISRDLLQGIKSGEYWKYLKLEPININRASEITIEQIEAVENMLSKDMTIKSIAKETKMSINTIRKIKNNEYQNLKNSIRKHFSECS